MDARGVDEDWESDDIDDLEEEEDALVPGLAGIPQPADAE